MAPIEDTLDDESGVESTFTETTQDLSLDESPFLGMAMSGDVAHAGFQV